MSGYRVCPVCGERVGSYVAHIVAEHKPTLSQLDRERVMETFDLHQKTAEKLLRQAGFPMQRGGVCPRCHRYAPYRTDHIMEAHLQVILAARASLGLTFPECVTALFDGWVHPETIAKLVRRLEDHTGEFPTNAILVCQGEDGRVRVMDRSEKGIGVVVDVTSEM